MPERIVGYVPSTKLPDLDLDGVVVENVELHQAEEELITGVVVLLGTHHHVQLLKVKDNDEGEQVATKDPHNRYEDMQGVYDGRYETVQVPDVDGDWVLCIFPHCD